MRPPAFQDVTTALCISALAGVVLVAFLHANPGRGADHYWLEKHPPTYAVMKMCQVVIVAALAYNARFVLSHLFDRVVDRIRGGRTFKPT